MSNYQQQAVNLQQILDAKERRAQLQAELRLLYDAAVVSITVNMPGGFKYNRDTVALIYSAVDKVKAHVERERFQLLEERICHAVTGPAALLAIQGKPDTIKAFAVAIETEAEYGRLLDIDVFDADGRQINRAAQGLPARTCFVCSADAVSCMRLGRHSQAEITSMVRRLFTQYHAERAAAWPGTVAAIGTTAVEAMLLEAACAPAPGLVDRFNSGAHDDMDIFTFIKSSCALTPAMHQCALAAYRHNGPAAELLPVLRQIGVKAERQMFEATGGVNTQKGLLFLMGVVTAATSLAIKTAAAGELAGRIICEAANICKGIIERELAVLKTQLPARRLTPGERFYLSCGATGIRGELEAGLPVVVSKGLPVLKDALDQGLSLNDSLIQTLICLMTAAEDTTILNRHGLATLRSVQRDAAEIAALGGVFTTAGLQRIKELDSIYTAQRISPGGSADLLAVTYYLYVIEQRLAAAGAPGYVK